MRSLSVLIIFLCFAEPIVSQPSALKKPIYWFYQGNTIYASVDGKNYTDIKKLAQTLTPSRVDTQIINLQAQINALSAGSIDTSLVESIIESLLTNAGIKAASESDSGMVTNRRQIFSGGKTFSDLGLTELIPNLYAERNSEGYAIDAYSQDYTPLRGRSSAGSGLYGVSESYAGIYGYGTGSGSYGVIGNGRGYGGLFSGTDLYGIWSSSANGIGGYFTTSNPLSYAIQTLGRNRLGGNTDVVGNLSVSGTVRNSANENLDSIVTDIYERFAAIQVEQFDSVLVRAIIASLLGRTMSIDSVLIMKRIAIGGIPHDTVTNNRNIFRVGVHKDSVIFEVNSGVHELGTWNPASGSFYAYDTLRLTSSEFVRTFWRIVNKNLNDSNFSAMAFSGDDSNGVGRDYVKIGAHLINHNPNGITGDFFIAVRHSGAYTERFFIGNDGTIKLTGNVNIIGTLSVNGTQVGTGNTLRSDSLSVFETPTGAALKVSVSKSLSDSRIDSLKQKTLDSLTAIGNRTNQYRQLSKDTLIAYLLRLNAEMDSLKAHWTAIMTMLERKDTITSNGYTKNWKNDLKLNITDAILSDVTDTYIPFYDQTTLMFSNTGLSWDKVNSVFTLSARIKNIFDPHPGWVFGQIDSLGNMGMMPMTGGSGGGSFLTLAGVWSDNVSLATIMNSKVGAYQNLGSGGINILRGISGTTLQSGTLSSSDFSESGNVFSIRQDVYATDAEVSAIQSDLVAQINAGGSTYLDPITQRYDSLWFVTGKIAHFGVTGCNQAIDSVKVILQNGDSIKVDLQWGYNTPFDTVFSSVGWATSTTGGTVYSTNRSADSIASGMNLFMRVDSAKVNGDGTKPSWFTVTVFRHRITAVTGGNAPSVPGNFVATPTSTSAVYLSWDDVSGESGYSIERKTGVGGTYSVIYTPAANATSYSNTGLSDGTIYYYRMRSYNGYGYSSYATEDTAKTVEAAPTAPSALSASAVSSSQIHLTWTDNSSKEDSSHICRRAPGESIYYWIASVGANVTTYDNTGLTASTLYYYKIIAIKTGVTPSDSSNEASVQTDAASQSVPTLDTYAEGSLNWATSDYADITVGNNSNRVLISAGNSSGSVYYDSCVAFQSGTRIGKFTSVTSTISSGLTSTIFRYIAPPTGTVRVYFYRASGQSGKNVVQSWYNVHQTTPIPNYGFDDDYGQTPICTTATATNHVIAFFGTSTGVAAGVTISPSNGETMSYGTLGNNVSSFGGYKLTSSGTSFNSSWSITGATVWILIGVDLQGVN